MPGWLIMILVNLALKFGVPWLLKKFPWLPPNIAEIIEDLVGKVKGAKATKKEAYKEAKRKIRECQGTACAPQVKETV